MDHSLKSSKGKVVSRSSKNPEESGWTTYFEDFSKGIEPSSYDCSSSLLSDAASSAAWKISHHHHHVHNNLVAPNLSKKLCFKKTRTKQISGDDPLEDTASSPVSSPKVRDLISSPTSKIGDDQLQGSMGKEFTSSENHSYLETDDMHELQLNGNNIDCTELKKRGLCLVPMSLLANYLE